MVSAGRSFPHSETLPFRSDAPPPAAASDPQTSLLLIHSLPAIHSGRSSPSIDALEFAHTQKDRACCNELASLIRSHPPPHAGCPRGGPGPLPVLTHDRVLPDNPSRRR